ncbi:hypothetical protein BDV18DRAFT_161265 [Aspergillus unguis]
MKTAFLLVLALICCVNGCFLDSSCDSIRDTLIDSLGKTMTMAEGALDALNTDKDDNVRELRRWFFQDSDMDLLKSVYGGVLKFKTLRATDNKDQSEPTIFCDLSRWTEKQRKTRNGEIWTVVDESTGFTQKNDAEYAECKKNPGNVMAYWEHYKQGKKDINYIQICPWYLKKVKGFKVKNVVGALPDTKSGKVYDPAKDSARNSKKDPGGYLWCETRLCSAARDDACGAEK